MDRYQALGHMYLRNLCGTHTLYYPHMVVILLTLFIPALKTTTIEKKEMNVSYALVNYRNDCHLRLSFLIEYPVQTEMMCNNS